MPDRPSDAALIVIDAQESFRHYDGWRDEDVPVFIERQQALIDGMKSAGIPCFRSFTSHKRGPFPKARDWSKRWRLWPSRPMPFFANAVTARWWDRVWMSG